MAASGLHRDGEALCDRHVCLGADGVRQERHGLIRDGEALRGDLRGLDVALASVACPLEPPRADGEVVGETLTSASCAPLEPDVLRVLIEQGDERLTRTPQQGLSLGDLAHLAELVAEERTRRGEVGADQGPVRTIIRCGHGPDGVAHVRHAGLLLASLYIVFLVAWPALRPEIAPAPEDAEDVDLALVLSVLRDIVPAAALILAVLGSIFFGIATPTEASGVGAFGALCLAAWRGRLGRSVLQDVLRETSLTTGYLFGIFVGASAFALVLRGLGGDELIARGLLGLPFGPNGVVLSILFVTFLLGFFLDWIEITFIVLPLVAPIVVELGFDLVWFTVLFAVCLQTSFLTPPVGFALFYVKGVAPPEIDVRTLYVGILPFVGLQLIGLALIFVWPELATWLPAQAYGDGP